MKLKNIIILSYLFSSISLFAARWTVLIYMEPGSHDKADALYDAAWRNINDLARAHISDDVNILVQLHAYDQCAWRYKIEKGVIRQIAIAPLTNYYDDMRDAFWWAYGNYPADHYGLIWWGRGCGILEPSWQDHQIHFEDDAAFSLCLSCPRTVSTEAKRAILFESASQQYLSNDNMVKLLKEITESIIGEKLSFVGLDCCLGAAVEHAYQMQPYVDYMIGCQNCELPDGYEYYGLANRLSDPRNTTVDIVQGIVADYGAYYQERAQLKVYTLSVLNCMASKLCVQLIKQLSLHLCSAVQNVVLKSIIKELIIQKCPHFCFLPMYTDLYCVVTTLMDSMQHEPLWQQYTEKDNLILILTTMKSVIEKMVVANITGANMTAAHGVSIYWPLSHVDSSYFQTVFAHDTQWIQFLCMMHE